MTRFVLLTLGSGGDLFPFIRIGKVLLAEGHQVTLVTHCVYEAQVKKYGFNFVSFDTLSEYQLMMNDEIQVKVQDPKVYVEYYKRYLFPRLEKTFDKIREVCESNTIIIAHNLAQALAQMISEKLDLRYITVFLAPSFLESIIQTPGYIMSYISEEFNYIRNKVGLSPITNWRGMLDYYNHGIAFWPEWFGDYTPRLEQPITYAGFLLHENLEIVSNELMDWFEENQPIIITHGTTPPISDKFFSSCIAASAELGYPNIVVSKNNNVIPEMYQSLTKHEAFLPFSKVMSKARLLIHHGGIGTLGQAMRAGTPQLILGNGFDRPLNATHAKKLGVADFIPLPKWNKDEVAFSLNELITNSQFSNNCREVSYKVDQMGVEDKILEVVNKVLNSTQVPKISDLYLEGTKSVSDKKDSSQLMNLLKNLPAEKRNQLLLKLRR